MGNLGPELSICQVRLSDSLYVRLSREASLAMLDVIGMGAVIT
jgi:hypothetical protein